MEPVIIADERKSSDESESEVMLAVERKSSDDSVKVMLRTSSDEQESLCTTEARLISRPYTGSEREKSSRINFDRWRWQIGYSLEVYSTSRQQWFVGQVIEENGENISVMYNGYTKEVSRFDEKLRPLEAFSKRVVSPIKETITDAVKLRDLHASVAMEVAKGSMENDTYLSHVQKDAQNTVALIGKLLAEKGVSSWLDVEQDEITARTMSLGIARARTVLVYLTENYFRRKMPIFELEMALALSKPLVLVWEQDKRHGGFESFDEVLCTCPEKYKGIFTTEAIRYDRREPMRSASVEAIANRIRLPAARCCSVL